MARLFKDEHEHVGRVFGADALAIEHVGSTAVAGLAAKPIIDVLVGLRELTISEAQIGALRGLGYAFAGENVWRVWRDDRLPPVATAGLHQGSILRSA